MMIQKIVIQRPFEDWNPFWLGQATPPLPGRGIFAPSEEEGLVAGGEPAPDLFEGKRLGLVSDFAKRAFEIVDEGQAEFLVGNRPGDDVIELAAAPGQLLRGAHPALWGRRERAQKLRKPLFVISSGRRHQSQDGSAA
jgi:hypothetical protein